MPFSLMCHPRSTRRPAALVACCGLIACAGLMACKSKPDPIGQDPGDPAQGSILKPDQTPSMPEPSDGSSSISTELRVDPSREAPLDQIALPAGFDISYYAKDVPGARSMALGEDGTLYVGTRRQGDVWALRDEDGDGLAEARFTIASGLNSPNGVALKDGALYVAEIDRVRRFDAIASRIDDPPRTGHAPPALPLR